MREIDRVLFVSLNTEEYGMYYVLNDNNFIMRFYADSDELAIEKFHAFLNLSNVWNFNLMHNDFKLNGDILTVSPSSYEGDDIAITIWQINIFSGEHRHKGITKGCFWTDWER